MEHPNLTQEAFPSGATPLKWYTVTEAAAYLAAREEDILALLPDTAIVMEVWPPSRLSSNDLEILERLIHTIREIYAESVYGGGDL